MPKRETSEEMSQVAGRILASGGLPDNATVTVADYNDLLKDARRLAGSVLSQDESPFRRIGRALSGALGKGRSEPNARR